MFRRDFTYTSSWAEGSPSNWFHTKYYYAGANARYWTFQMALNLLSQQTDNPVIIETGCQRQQDDIGAGMSTSIFGEYCKEYGGKVISVDMIEHHLNVCRACCSAYTKQIEYVLSDSLTFLQSYKGRVDLLYLDSVDYPIGDQAGDEALQTASQTHSLAEFCAAENKLHSKTILLIDDNQLPGGGKPKLLKEYLETRGWVCLFDFQQSLWMPKW